MNELSTAFSFTIDWLSVTFPQDDAKSFAKKSFLGKTVPSTKNKGQHGYNRRVTYENGTVRMFSTERADMGEHFVFSGSALTNIWQNNNFSPYDLLLSALDFNGRVSRIDFAIDVRGIELSPTAMYKMANIRKKGKGNTPKPYLTVSLDGGETLYIGSRESTKMLRIYNKAAEQKVDGFWTRIELEMKEEVAHAVGYQAAYLSQIDFFRLCAGMIRDFYLVDNDVYVAALSDAGARFDVPKKQGTDTMAWLMNAVAPSVARLMMENPNRAIWQEFQDAVLAVIEREEKKYTP